MTATWDLRYRVKGGRHVHAANRWKTQAGTVTITACGYPINPYAGHHPLPASTKVTCPGCIRETGGEL